MALEMFYAGPLSPDVRAEVRMSARADTRHVRALLTMLNLTLSFYEAEDYLRQAAHYRARQFDGMTAA